MPVSKNLREKILAEIDSISLRATEISEYIFDNPEIGGCEFLAQKILTGELEKNGFTVKKNIGGLKTAFLARHDFGKPDSPGPSLAFLAEYDALPKMGHACHHHLIAASSVCAAIALSRLKDDIAAGAGCSASGSGGAGGSIVVAGTPAEEIMDAKSIMAKSGAFKDVDAAIMFHGGCKSVPSPGVLAIDCLEFRFRGRASHAASAPYEGINALDAVILLFTSINALRQQLREDAKIHGIITDGGSAVNIIPENAAARFYIRSRDRKYLDRVTAKIKDCAKGAALQTGTRLSISVFEESGSDLLVNSKLAGEFESSFISLGGKFDTGDYLLGSTDTGNLSHMLPVLFPVIRTAAGNAQLHTEKFLKYGKSEIARSAMILVMKAMALTALRLFTEPDFLAEVKKEFLKVTVKS
jgi:amidohydrolase